MKSYSVKCVEQMRVDQTTWSCMPKVWQARNQVVSESSSHGTKHCATVDSMRLLKHMPNERLNENVGFGKRLCITHRQVCTHILTCIHVNNTYRHEYLNTNIRFYLSYFIIYHSPTHFDFRFLQTHLPDNPVTTANVFVDESRRANTSINCRMPYEYKSGRKRKHEGISS